MKNILVKSLYQVEDTNWHFRDRKDEDDLYDKYMEMHRISVASHSRHLKGDWELKFIGGRVKNINQAFQKTFFEIYNIWRQGNVNILYTDPDTLVIKDTDIWNISDHFMMFNFTDPKSFATPNQYQRFFPHFFNAGVRYFPAAMSQHIWDQAIIMANSWDENSYDTEQIILNSMLWDQGLDLHQVLRPNLAYQLFCVSNKITDQTRDLWNGFDLKDAQIIHLHASRDAKYLLQTMQNLAQQLKLI
jgi:hypothetical protein